MNRIRQLRKERRLSTTWLAEKIGVSYRSLWSYEVGESEPNFQTLIRLADFFNVTVDYLIGREPKNKTIKSYRYYIFDEDDYALRDLGEGSPTPGFSVPILDESEFKFLKILCDCYYENEISDDSFKILAEILANKEAFYVEVIERVDS